MTHAPQPSASDQSQTCQNPVTGIERYHSVFPYPMMKKKSNEEDKQGV